MLHGHFITSSDSSILFWHNQLSSKKVTKSLCSIVPSLQSKLQIRGVLPAAPLISCCTSQTKADLNVCGNHWSNSGERRNQRWRIIFVQSENGSTFQAFYNSRRIWWIYMGIIKSWGPDFKHLSTGLKNSVLGQVCIGQNLSLFGTCSVLCVKWSDRFI